MSLSTPLRFVPLHLQSALPHYFYAHSFFSAFPRIKNAIKKIKSLAIVVFEALSFNRNLLLILKDNC